MDAEINVKQKILLSAKKLFSIHGFEGTSVRQMCEEAGVNLALVSYHFGGKENVFFALFEEYFPNRTILQVEEQFEDPLEKIKIIIESMILFRTHDPEMARILQQEIVKNTSRIEKMRLYLLPSWKIIRNILESGREKEIFHFRSIDHALWFVMASILIPKSNTFLDPILTEKDLPVEALIEDTTTYVLRGLGYQA